MPIKLVVRVPRGSTVEVSEHAFTRGKILIGRSPDCDLVLPGDEVRVSRQHIRIDKQEKAYVMVDLGSRNGTLLNGALITPNSTHNLRAGDTIKMGAVELLVQSFESATGSAQKSAGTSGREAPVQPQAEGQPAQPASQAAPADPKSSDALKALQALSKHYVGDAEFADGAQIRMFTEKIRVTLDAMLEGLFRILAARKQFEGEFDAHVTMAFQRASNPLKDAADLGAFKRYPVDWQSKTTPLEIHDALQRAVSDISQHQVGILAGMQDVLNAIIKKLDPTELEKQAGGGGLFRGKEKAAWRLYRQTYSEFLSQSSKLFNDIVYPNLQKGYLMSHKEKTKVIQNAAKFAEKAEEAQKAAEVVDESDVDVDIADESGTGGTGTPAA